MAKKATKRGGKRKGSGRKEAADPKLGVTFYIETSVIDANGGIEGAREVSKKALYAAKK